MFAAVESTARAASANLWHATAAKTTVVSGRCKAGPSLIEVIKSISLKE